MAGATWKFLLAESKDLTNIGELTQARDRQLQLVLDRSGTASFNIPMDDELGSQIQAVEHAIKAIRVGSTGLQEIWSGYVNTIDEDAPGNRMTVNCVGWYERLAKRLLHEDKSFLKVDDSEIAKAMLAHANGIADGEHPASVSSIVLNDGAIFYWPEGSSPNTPTYIRWGGTRDDDGGTLGTGQYAYLPSLRTQPTLPRYQTVLQGVIQSYADIENGYDWHIDPTTRELFIQRRRRRVLPEVVFGYRVGPENVAVYNRQTDGSVLTNYGLATGAANIRSVAVIKDESQKRYGPFEEVYSLSNVYNRDVLFAYAAGEVGIKSYPRRLQPFQPFNWTAENSVPEPFVDYRLGDQVTFIARQLPRIDVNQQVRVFGMSVAIDAEGNEKIGQLQIYPG